MNKDNWWLCDNNTNRYTPNNIPTKEYVYDGKLEEAAIQRAAELLFRYLHYRPNYIIYAGVYGDQNNPYQLGFYNEMITFSPMYTERDGHGVFTTNTAEGITYDFMEEYANMPGKQLHRACILTDKYYRIGIGVVKLADGHRFVVIEVAEDKLEDESYIPVYPTSDPVDGYKATTVQLAYKPGDPDKCFWTYFGTLGVTADSSNDGTVTLLPGQSFDLSSEWFTFGKDSAKGFGFCHGDDTRFFDPALGEWKSNDTSIAEVIGNKIIAKNTGYTKVQFTDTTDGHIIGGIYITVPEPVLQSATAAYDKKIVYPLVQLFTETISL